LSRIYDISWPINSQLAGWPGDAEFSLRWTMLQSRGDLANVGHLTMSSHTGTHTDAPFHLDSARATIDKVPLEAYLGPARLVDVRGKSSISVSELDRFDWTGTPRLLLRTGGWDDASRFPAAIPVMDGDVPGFLRRQDICLVGLDVPSVDVLDSDSLPVHRALGACNIHILEGLDLREPPPGVYELIALPLRISGGDGSPVRAILRTTRAAGP
jgi:arylformamidase